MPTERPVEPTLVQHVEAVRDELLAEQRALEELLRKNAQLREEIARLEARRQEFREELEALRQERPMSPPRLPAVLSPPFTVKVQQGLRRPLFQLLVAMYLSALLILVPQGLQTWPYVASFWGFLGGLALAAPFMRPRWRFFGEAAAEVGGIHAGESIILALRVALEKRSTFTYEQVRDVQVLVTPSQKRRGVGTVVIYRGSVLEELQWVTLLRNVPEPERLAEWIRSKCDSARNRGV